MTDLVIRVAGLRVPDGEGLVPGDVGQVGGRAEVHGALPIPPRVPNARSPGLFDCKSTRIISINFDGVRCNSIIWLRQAG